MSNNYGAPTPSDIKHTVPADSNSEEQRQHMATVENSASIWQQWKTAP